jgi:hypothetical protein
LEEVEIDINFYIAEIKERNKNVVVSEMEQIKILE